MSVDHIELLGWMATRERREGTYIDGTQLMVDASHLAGAISIPGRPSRAPWSS